MLFYAIILHLAWGVFLLFDAAPLNTTPLGSYPRNQYCVASILLLAGGMAWLSMHRRFDGTFKGLALCLPQQLLLMESAFTAVTCAFEGKYSDGTVRDGLFILVDQFPTILAMFLHTAALIDWSIHSLKVRADN